MTRLTKVIIEPAGFSSTLSQRSDCIVTTQNTVRPMIDVRTVTVSVTVGSCVCE